MEQLSFNPSLSRHPMPVPVVEPALERQSRRQEAGRPTGSVGFARGASSRGASAPQVPQGNVTEIILPEAQVENMQLLLPMLTQLNQERRWLAWIDPPQALMQKWQQMHGIVAGEILVLRSSDQHDASSLAERALRAGTCHAVVMWTGGVMGAPAFERLQSASAQGNSHGVVLRQR